MKSVSYTVGCGLLWAGCSSLFGCSYGGDERRVAPPRDVAPGEIASYAIDTDELVGDTFPGVGTGFFIEYESRGLWHVWASCDTERSSFLCIWDIVVIVADGVELSGVTEDELEARDVLADTSAGGLRLLAETDYDFDGFSFEADEGEPVIFDALLDGYPAHSFAYWVSDGELQDRGAETHPFELVPSDDLDEDG